MGKAVVHFEIRAKDAKGQQTFYSELFGWRLGEPDGPMRYQMIDTETSGISGGLWPPPSGTPGLTFYVQVDDLQGSLDRAASLGATTVVPPTPLPRGGRFAVIRDPEGNEVGLMGA